MLYGVRRVLLPSRHRLDDCLWPRIEAAFAAEDDLALECAWVGKEAVCDLRSIPDRVRLSAVRQLPAPRSPPLRGRLDRQ